MRIHRMRAFSYHKWPHLDWRARLVYWRKWCWQPKPSPKLLTNEERLRMGKFCLCNDGLLCDFHKRGAYTTHEDNLTWPS